VYTCSECAGCPHKAQCIKGASKTPLEERSKNLYVSKTFLRQRKEMQARIQSEEGILLRINRSIQVEGAFGVLKQDMGFRRFLMRGSAKVQTELLLLCMGYNLNKLHNKIQSGRCGTYLHISKVA
jgi:IS5 family transposase